MPTELLLLLASPLAGGLVLALMGHRRRAAEVNAAFSALTFAAAAALVTRVVANRMRTMLNEGLILNVMTMPTPRTAGEAALAGVARTALAAVTRGEAATWAPHGIRVNAIGPRATTPDAGADIAALALYLASKRSRTLTGHIFDAAGVAARRC